jgi:hypothetical protein
MDEMFGNFITQAKEAVSNNDQPTMIGKGSALRQSMTTKKIAFIKTKMDNEFEVRFLE